MGDLLALDIRKEPLRLNRMREETPQFTAEAHNSVYGTHSERACHKTTISVVGSTGDSEKPCFR